MRAAYLFILITCFTLASSAQTIGGNSIYNFLKLPVSPQLTALGGVNISNISNDITLSFDNPALLRPSMHMQLAADFNSMYAGIKNYHALIGYRSEKLATNFSLGTSYLDYGTIAQTDASGNVLGTFRPGDYVAQVSASRKYMERWYYGATIKFIHSNYGLYRSDGLALDAGAAYHDTASQVQVSILMKNMGVQLKKYEGTTGDDLPFDIEAGITKRLKNAPIQFSLTAQHLHQFNIRYNDTSFNNDNGFNQTGKAGITFDKIFRHIVFATQFYIGEKLELTAAYNHLRRTELDIYSAANGLNGFSLGVGVLFRKIQIRYARAYYQNNFAYNQVGLNLFLNEFSSL